MDAPIEFCALKYLYQWQSTERDLYRQIKNDPTQEDLRKALSYFRVARNFPGLNAENNSTPALSALFRIRARQNLSAIEKVIALADDFECEYKSFNLSAASKLLWLSSRRPFLILDSRAVTALTKRFGQRFDARNYAEYYGSWRTEYSKHESKICEAVERLPKVRNLMPDWPLSDKQLLDLVTNPWFKERVFDTYLWEIGGIQK